MRTKQELLTLLRDQYQLDYFTFINNNPKGSPGGFCRTLTEMSAVDIITDEEYNVLARFFDTAIHMQRQACMAYSIIGDNYSSNGWWLYHPKDITSRLQWINQQINQEIIKNIQISKNL